MTDLRLVRNPPVADWNDMKDGQIGWLLSPDRYGWCVERVFGPESLIENPVADVIPMEKTDGAS